MKTIYYSQEDSRWRNVMYSNHGDKTQTIGTSGCGPSSAAMAISTLTDKIVLPTTTADYAIKHGFRTTDSGTAWGFFASIAAQYGLHCRQTDSIDEVKAALATGALVIASMRPGHFTGGGHYILIVGLKNEGGEVWFEVHDPNHDNSKYGSDGLINQGTRNDGKVTARETVFKNEAGQYWIFTTNTATKNEEDEPMTAAEKKAFEELQATVKAQADRIAQLEDQQDMPAPDWAKDAVAHYGALMATKTGSLDFWRILVIQYRKETGK